MLNKWREVVGILSMGNNDHIALVVPIHSGLQLVTPMLEAMARKNGSGGSGSGGGSGGGSRLCSNMDVDEELVSHSIPTTSTVRSAAELAAGITLTRCQTPDFS